MKNVITTVFSETFSSFEDYVDKSDEIRYSIIKLSIELYSAADQIILNGLKKGCTHTLCHKHNLDKVERQRTKELSKIKAKINADAVSLAYDRLPWFLFGSKIKRIKRNPSDTRKQIRSPENLTHSTITNLFPNADEKKNAVKASAANIFISAASPTNAAATAEVGREKVRISSARTTCMSLSSPIFNLIDNHIHSPDLFLRKF